MGNAEILDKKVERLQKAMNKKLTINSWHNHVSVYTEGVNKSCQDRILSTTNTTKAIEYVDAILDTLYIIERGKK